MLEHLLAKYEDEGVERLGFILSDDTIVELDNVSVDKHNGGNISSYDLHKYLYSGEFNVVATWHTHPNSPSILSGEDYSSFLQNPNLDHYIIGNDGVSKYYVEDGVVKNG